MIDFHIRCDFYSDHYLEGEIEDKLLKLTICNGDFCENYSTELYLSKEGAVKLAKELLNEVEFIEQVEKSDLI